MPRRWHRLAGLLAVCLLVGAATPVASADDAAPAMPPLQADRDDTAQLRRAAAELAQDAATEASQQRSAAPLTTMGLTGQASGLLREYVDVCDDTGSSPIDLRFTALDDDGAGQLTLYHISCRTWTAADLGDGDISMFVYLPDGRGDGPDYLVSIFQFDGDFNVFVWSTPTNDPGTWAPTYVGDAQRTSGRRGVAAVLPKSAIGGADEFAFYVSSYDAQGRVDELPEADREQLLLFPFSCRVYASDRASVTAEPAHFDAAVRAAEAEGLTVTAASAPTGTFEVRGLHARTGAAERLASSAAVADVADPVLLEPAAVVPDDPGYPHQWALPAVGAEEAWEVRTGSGRSLAVIDDGVDGGRADLAGRVLAGRDAVFDQPLAVGANSDLGGHGTAVAGVAAAAGDNGTALAGVDWEAQVLPVRVGDAAGCISDTAVAAGITWAADEGADVINLSLGATQRSATLADAVAYAQTGGSVVVAAAGNDVAGDAVIYPAGLDGVIGVGATTNDGTVAGYSNRNSSVDLVAPGGDATGTPAGDILTLGAFDALVPAAGTSFSAPMVAGAAALYLASHPGAEPDAVADALVSTATEAGDAGRDDAYGHGILDLAALLDSAPTGVAQARSIDAGCPDGEVPDAPFTDVADGNDHAAAIDCIFWWEVTTGKTATTYGPAASVTRAEMAAFIARVIEHSGGQLPDDPDDAFGDDDGSTHEHAIDQLAAVDIVNGKRVGIYGPDASVSRAEMAAFLARAAKHRWQPLALGADYFSDDDGHTHEDNINRIAAAGLTGGDDVGGYDPDGDVRRDQMGSFLARLLALLVESAGASTPG